MNKNESKYFNTANKMHDALIQILDRKDFEYISVKEICEAAGVNRSTFYLHYDNLNDLLSETVEAAYKDFFARYSELPEAKGLRIEDKKSEELFLITPQFLSPYLDFVKENRRLFRLMNEKTDVLGSEKMYGNWFKNIFGPILTKFGVPKEEQPYIMIFYMKGLIGMVTEWVNNDCSTSKEVMMEIISKCIIKP